MWKRFFCFQNPALLSPPREKDPNWKLREFLLHILAGSVAAWSYGMAISIDKQTIGFQRQHGDKLCITYKREGDGFQCDALCNDGYIYSFYFRKEPPPAKYTEKGFSPLHVHDVIVSLKYDYHRCRMDNLYT